MQFFNNGIPCPLSVSDPHPSRPDREDKRTFLQKLAEFIHPGPDSTDELIETLVDAEQNNIIGAESRQMLEGVLRMADMTAGDVMVPTTRMDLVDIGEPLDSLLRGVIDAGHSRFPVFEGDRENIIGQLHELCIPVSDSLFLDFQSQISSPYATDFIMDVGDF